MWNSEYNDHLERLGQLWDAHSIKQAKLNLDSYILRLMQYSKQTSQKPAVRMCLKTKDGGDKVAWLRLRLMISA